MKQNSLDNSLSLNAFR